MMFRLFVGAAAVALLQVTGAACAQSRGELLYSTHCVACHTTEVHWRDHRLATDWPSLRAQVRRWQAVASLDWNEDDIDAVARHLNERYYGFAEPGGHPVATSPKKHE